MASLFSRNALLAGKIMSRSVQSGPYAFKIAQNLNIRSGSQMMSNSRSLVLSRGFADSKSTGNHLKDGLPEQYQWTAQHLETYLRKFASNHGFKEADVEHLIKTFVTGSSSASEFFKLDREALAAKIGKESPERTKMANLLVAEVWKETEAVGRKMQNFGSIIIGVAALVFGGWAVSHFMGNDSKKDVKNAAHDAKKDVKSVAHDAKESIKDGAKSAASSVKSVAHDVKESAKSAISDAKSSATNAKDSVKNAAHDAKDSAKNAAHDAKDSAKNAANNVKGSAHDAKKDVKDAAKDVKETAKNNKDDAKAKTAQAFKDDGAVGKQFTEKGAIGGTAQKIGGPFDKEGAVGKQFTKDGAIGGAVQKKAEQKDDEYSKKQEEYYKNKK